MAIFLSRLVDKNDLLKQIHPGISLFLFFNDFLIDLISPKLIFEPLYNTPPIKDLIFLVFNP